MSLIRLARHTLFNHKYNYIRGFHSCMPKKQTYYTVEHEKIEIKDENTLTIGITDYAKKELGDIIHIEPEIEEDDKIEKNDILVTIESIKAVSEILSPIEGSVIEYNPLFIDDVSCINTMNENNEEYWLVKCTYNKKQFENDLKELMDGVEYSNFIKSK